MFTVRQDLQGVVQWPVRNHLECVEAASFTNFVSLPLVSGILLGFLYSKVIQCLLSFKGILVIWDFYQTKRRPTGASIGGSEKCSYFFKKMLQSLLSNSYQ